MALKITKQEYTKLIEQDLDILRKHLPDSPENDHIRLVLCNSIDMHYPSDGKQPQSENGKLPIPHVSGSLPFKDDVELAKWMHDTYEEVALEIGWETQPKCKTQFDKLPTENKITMIEVAGRLLTKLRQ